MKRNKKPSNTLVRLLRTFVAKIIRQATNFLATFNELLTAFGIATYRATAVLFKPQQWLRIPWLVSSALTRWWRGSERFRHLVYGFPALVVVGYATYLAFVASGALGLTARYESLAATAMKQEDFPRAKLCLERLLFENGPRPRTLLTLAQVFAQEGNHRRVAAIMTRLAPADVPISPEAHLWKASTLLAKKELTREELIEVERQLQNVITLEPQNAAAHSLFGQVLFQTGRYAAALQQYQAIGQRNAADNYQLAEAAARIADIDLARSAANRALRQFSETYKSQPDSQSSHANVVKALVFLENFPDAVRMIDEAPSAFDRDQLRRQKARVLATWAQFLFVQGKDIPKQVELIEGALKEDTELVAAYDRLLNLIQQTSSNELERLRDMLRKMLAAGRATSLVHLCMGTDAILHDNVEQGLLHLRIAVQENPSLVAATNNLAWAMAHAEEPDLKGALALVDAILKDNGEVAAVHDTRGQILAKQEKWQNAVVELEIALRDMPNSEVTRRTLVVCYKSLGLENLAAEHERILIRTK